MDVSICIGSACHLKGSYDIIAKLKELIAENKMEDMVNIKATFCLGNCKEAVSVKIEDTVYSVQPEKTESFFHTVICKKVSK